MMWLQSLVVALSVLLVGVPSPSLKPKVGWSIDRYRNVVWVTIPPKLYRCENTVYGAAYDQVLREIAEGYKRRDLLLVEAILEDIVPKVCQRAGGP